MEGTLEESPVATKRRRKVKANADKKYECRYDGCGKTYSRAEHLYRHHLNRELQSPRTACSYDEEERTTDCFTDEPKAIYRCQYPGCSRSFVRQDLCVRHEERHSSQGSQLQKRDASSRTPGISQRRASSGATATVAEHKRYSSSGSASAVPSAFPHRESYSVARHDRFSHPFRGEDRSDPPALISPTSVESPDQLMTSETNLSTFRPSLKSASSPSDSALSPSANSIHDLSSRSGHRTGFPGGQGIPSDFGLPTKISSRRTSQREDRVEAQDGLTGGKNTIHAHSNSASRSHFGLSTPAAGLSSLGAPETSRRPFATVATHSFDTIEPFSTARYRVPIDGAALALNTNFSYPIFGGDECHRSPSSREAEFAAWLFSESQPDMSAVMSSSGLRAGYSDMGFPSTVGPFHPDLHFEAYYPPHVQPQHPMSLMNLLDPTAPSPPCMSEEKRSELLDIMRDRFQERPDDAVRGYKDVIASGNLNSDDHILSLRMLHIYVGSYFYHQHAQIPILHRPTFCADKTHNLLLLIIIAIGAATLDKAYGNALADTAANFANFIAWHVRWEIVRDVGYRPPAQLWAFQTLVLLEVYEKMYSTRVLHERAHINHDTTLTLMRRGTSLTGKTANESPGSLREARTARSSGSTSASDAVASDESWSQWIRNEATCRIAFAAFVIDSIHATMFGHSAKMVAYEIHLPLPCDEALWGATSAAEVAQIRTSHQTHGIKPVTFLEGLKRTLNGEKVRTNSFGRTILMCGLLSVNYLLNQRDMQMTALDRPAVQSSGPGGKWRATLLRAFDNWMKDFDDALAEVHLTGTAPVSAFNLRRIDDDNLFESRIVLHHLAHIASCVDVVDCQIYAGARRLLGRPIGVKDFTRVRDKMVNRWCRTSNARSAAFHALQFLVQVLLQPSGADTGSGSRSSSSNNNNNNNNTYEKSGPQHYRLARGHSHAHNSHGVSILPHAFDERGRYVARDDFLLNRPWVLYFSALVVWCYGYALEGPLSPPPPDSTFATPEACERDMRRFLGRFSSSHDFHRPRNGDYDHYYAGHQNCAAGENNNPPYRYDGPIESPAGLENVAGMNENVGLLMVLKDSFEATRWELTHEAALLLNNCINKSLGREGGT